MGNEGDAIYMNKIPFTVLGIMGAANSGKDFVADWFVENKNFVKVSFADVMKRFAAQVFNYTEGQLWGPSDMRNATTLADDYSWGLWEKGFDEHLPAFVRQMQFDSVIRQGLLAKALKGWFLKLRLEYRNQQLSPRIVLQLLGTEMGRNFDENLWVNYIYDVVVPKLHTGKYVYNKAKGCGEIVHVLNPTKETVPIGGVVIADHRFKNEVKATQNRNGFVIRVRRLSKEGTDDSVGLRGHKSEAEMKEIPDSELNLTLKLNDGKDAVYPILEHVFDHQTWLSQGESVGPELPIPERV